MRNRHHNEPLFPSDSTDSKPEQKLTNCELKQKAKDLADANKQDTRPKGLPGLAKAKRHAASIKADAERKAAEQARQREAERDEWRNKAAEGRERYLKGLKPYYSQSNTRA